jgi:hypothetical protein
VNMPSSGSDLTKMDCDFHQAAVSKMTLQDLHGYRELIPHWNILHWTSIDNMRWFSSNQKGHLLWTCPVQAQIWQWWITTALSRSFKTDMAGFCCEYAQFRIRFDKNVSDWGRWWDGHGCVFCVL